MRGRQLSASHGGERKKHRIIFILLCTTMCLLLAGCGKKTAGKLITTWRGTSEKPPFGLGIARLMVLFAVHRPYSHRKNRRSIAQAIDRRFRYMGFCFYSRMLSAGGELRAFLADAHAADFARPFIRSKKRARRMALKGSMLYPLSHRLCGAFLCGKTSAERRGKAAIRRHGAGMG